LHEVIYGSGKCIMLDKEIPYQPGTAALIPAGIKHRVIAEQGTLYLLAKFVPALQTYCKVLLALNELNGKD